MAAAFFARLAGVVPTHAPAVAIAAAIGADRCDINTDVDGVYTTDPRVVPKAHRMDKIAYEEMLELASLGAKVMQAPLGRVGMVRDVRIRTDRASKSRKTSIPRSRLPAHSFATQEHRANTTYGIAFSKDEAQISIRRVQDKPCTRRRDPRPLADANINVDMIVQNVSGDGATTDLTFTVPTSVSEMAEGRNRV